jgi:uncharacterized cupin superfamily protein
MWTAAQTRSVQQRAFGRNFRVLFVVESETAAYESVGVLRWFRQQYIVTVPSLERNVTSRKVTPRSRAFYAIPSATILRWRMRDHWKHRIVASSAALMFTALSTVAMHAQGEAIKPVKLTKPEIAGPIFQRKDAVHDKKDGNATADVVTFTSGDSGFQTGMYKSGPLHEVIANAAGYPYNEFLYFIAGGATLTSSDGSVITVRAGDAVTIPRGWTGTFDTKGYIKMYVTYNPDDIKK